MLPIQFLDLIEELTRLDPVRTYVARSTTCIAKLVEAGHVDYEHSEITESTAGETNDVASENDERLSIPLRAGKRAMGILHLSAPRDRKRFAKDDVRVARWAARVAATHMVYAERLREEGRGTAKEPIESLLARSPLTPRERDVVGLLLSGASTKKIASSTGLTIATVHTYLKRIYPKLGVHSRVELVARMAGTGDALDHAPRTR